LIFDPAADFPFTVPKALVSHGLAWVLAAVLVALFVRFGPSFLVWSWLHVPVLFFLGAEMLAAVFAVDRTLALYGTHARMLGLATVMDFIVLYFAVILLVRTRREAVVVLASVAASAGLVLAYEAVQLLGLDPFTWSIIVTARPISTLGQPTTLAEYLLVIAVGVLATSLLVDLFNPQSRLLLAVFGVALLAGAGATATRSAAIGLVAASAVLILMIWRLHPSSRARLLSLATAAVAMATLTGLLAFTPAGARIQSTLTSFSDDAARDDTTTLIDPSADTRSALYSIALQMVSERPVLGYGPDNFAVGVPRYRPENAYPEVQQSLATSPHSWLANIVTSGGLLALIGFLSIVVMVLALPFRGGFRPLAIVAAAMVFAFLGAGLTTVDDVSTDWLFWASAGLTAAATASPMRGVHGLVEGGRRTRTKARYERQGTGLVRTTAIIACLAAGVGLAISGFSAFGASRANLSAQQARLQGRATQGVSLSLHATQLDPGRAEYWHGLGLGYAALSRLREASAAFETARELAPYDVRYVGDLVRAQILLDRNGEPGARARALQLGDQAVQTDPNNPRANQTRALVMQVTGNLPEAIKSVERAITLDRWSGNGPLYLTATQIYLASGRATDAVRVAQMGVASLSPPIVAVPLRVELARALAAAGQAKEALAELDAVLVLQPNQAAALQLRAEIQAGMTK
jgi:O-antigen ligase/Flp pilus assembly protein TadD